MAAFSELDWSRIDVFAIVSDGGIATVEERRRMKCLEWLRAEGYEVESVDCRKGLEHVVPQLGRIFQWQENFGYELQSDSRNLDALRDGFEFEILDGHGKVLELVGPHVIWQEDSFWSCGLLRIAADFSRIQLALGRRFFALLVVPENSPFIGATYEQVNVPVPFWNPCESVHEFGQ